MSRDTADFLTIARDLKMAGIGLRSLAEPVIDTTSEFSDIVLAVLGLAAKLEHKRIRERTAAGRAKAKADGVKFGAKPKLNHFQQREAIRRRDVEREPLRRIARSYNVSAQTMSRLKAEQIGVYDGFGRIHYAPRSQLTAIKKQLMKTKQQVRQNPTRDVP